MQTPKYGVRPRPPTYQYPATDLSLLVPDQVDADVMDVHGRTVIFCTAHSNLELAWQKRKLWMERRPLAYYLTIGTRVFQFILSYTGKMIGGDIAYAVPTCLDSVHLYAGQVSQDIGHGFQPGPVELNILPGSEMAVPLVILLGDMRQHPKLDGRQQAIGYRHAQHRCMPLDIQPVHQAQRSILILAEFTGQVATGLITKLGKPVRLRSADHIDHIYT